MHPLKVYSLVNFDKCIQECNQYYKIRTISIIPRSSFVLLCSQSPLPISSPWADLSVLRVLPFPYNHIKWMNLLCLTFFSLSIMLSRFIHVVSVHSFSLLNNIQIMFGYFTICISIHQLMDSWFLFSFWLLCIKLLWILYTSPFVDICCYFF